MPLAATNCHWHFALWQYLRPFAAHTLSAFLMSSSRAARTPCGSSLVSPLAEQHPSSGASEQVPASLHKELEPSSLVDQLVEVPLEPVNTGRTDASDPGAAGPGELGRPSVPPLPPVPSQAPVAPLQQSWLHYLASAFFCSCFSAASQETPHAESHSPCLVFGTSARRKAILDAKSAPHRFSSELSLYVRSAGEARPPSSTHSSASEAEQRSAASSPAATPEPAMAHFTWPGGFLVRQVPSTQHGSADSKVPEGYGLAAKPSFFTLPRQ